MVAFPGVACRQACLGWMVGVGLAWSMLGCSGGGKDDWCAQMAVNSCGDEEACRDDLDAAETEARAVDCDVEFDNLWSCMGGEVGAGTSCDEGPQELCPEENAALEECSP